MRSGGYDEKSLWVMTLSLGDGGMVEGRAEREKTVTCETAGSARAARRMSMPAAPVAPVKINFMTV